MSRFAGLPQALSARATTRDDDTPPDNINDEEEDAMPPSPTRTSAKKDDVMNDQELASARDSARAEGRTEGFTAATDRIKAVMESPHFAGREASAMKLLAKASLASASADDLADILADQPKAEPAALSAEEQREAHEEGGRAEMRAALAKHGSSDIDADAGRPDTKAAAADRIWDQAFAHNDAMRPE